MNSRSPWADDAVFPVKPSNIYILTQQTTEIMGLFPCLSRGIVVELCPIWVVCHTPGGAQRPLTEMACAGVSRPAERPARLEKARLMVFSSRSFYRMIQHRPDRN